MVSGRPIGHEQGRWYSTFSSRSHCLCLSSGLFKPKKKKNTPAKTTPDLARCRTRAERSVRSPCVWVRMCLGLATGLWMWCSYIEESCPVCQRALSATLFSDKALVKGLTPAGHGCWGERAAAALQTHSPAGGDYLSHLVHSSGWPTSSTTTSSPGEGHIWPYLGMRVAVYQHTVVEPLKKTHTKYRNIKKKFANVEVMLKNLVENCIEWSSVWEKRSWHQANSRELHIDANLFLRYKLNYIRNSYTFTALNKKEIARWVSRGNEWPALFVYASVMLLWPFLFMPAKLWAHPWLLFTW